MFSIRSPTHQPTPFPPSPGLYIFPSLHPHTHLCFLSLALSISTTPPPTFLSPLPPPLPAAPLTLHIHHTLASSNLTLSSLAGLISAHSLSYFSSLLHSLLFFPPSLLFFLSSRWLRLNPQLFTKSPKKKRLNAAGEKPHWTPANAEIRVRMRKKR